MIALIAIAGVAEIIWKSRKGRRSLSSHRPDARTVNMLAPRPNNTTTRIDSAHLARAAEQADAEDARHRRNAKTREAADAKAERARRLRPWDHH